MSNTIKALEEMVMANIVRTEIEEEKAEGGKTYVFTTASEAGITPYLSEGEEKIHRVKNQILGMNNTEDIVLGYDIKLVNNTFTPELLSVVDGGTVTYDEDEKFQKYEAPEAGTVVNREKVTINVYTEEKDCDGETTSYLKFTFKHAKGTPVEYSIKDGEFFVPEMTLKARAKRGEKPVVVEVLTELPTDEVTPGV